jgi:hypothetical protein
MEEGGGRAGREVQKGRGGLSRVRRMRGRECVYSGEIVGERLGTH